MTDKGIRMPLIIDGAMLVAVLFMAGVFVTRQDSMADDIAEIQAKEIPERVVRIEEQVKHVSKTVERNAEKLDENQAIMREILRKVDPS